MRNIYHYEDINPHTRTSTGSLPIRSDIVSAPSIHNAAFRELKLDRVYVPFRVPRVRISKSSSVMLDSSASGLSVTIPHKETIVPLCTHTDQAVDHIGAANTVVIDGYDRRASIPMLKPCWTVSICS